MAAIDVRGLTKTYGETVAIDDLTFAVREGEIFGYLGPNGAGKTTTIRTLMGFQSPTDGTAFVLGRDVREEAELLRAKAEIGYLPSDPGFDGDVTGEEFLDYQASLKGDVRREELLELFRPPLSRRIREYSSGNEQMLGIVQAFMHDPNLVVMDEPTAGLDPLKQERFNRFLRAERDRGTTVLFSSHVLGEVRRVCDRVGIIRNGRLVALEDVESLLHRGGKRVRVRTATPLDSDDLSLDGVVDLALTGQDAQFTFAGDYNALLDRLAEHDVIDLDVEEPPLEDVFMHFYGEADDRPGGSDVDGRRSDADGRTGTDDGRTGADDGEGAESPVDSTGTATEE
ncbi:MAG: ATP-binding cassette domain-containing protein [Salinigranum sp.]